MYWFCQLIITGFRWSSVEAPDGTERGVMKNGGWSYYLSATISSIVSILYSDSMFLCYPIEGPIQFARTWNCCPNHVHSSPSQCISSQMSIRHSEPWQRSRGTLHLLNGSWIRRMNWTRGKCVESSSRVKPSFHLPHQMLQFCSRSDSYHN